MSFSELASLPILENGCWAEIRRGAAMRRPCLFLDRDGVVVEEVNYLHRVEDVRIIDGSLELIRSAKSAGWACGIITNQAGIGRGYYGWEEFKAIHDCFDKLLMDIGCKLDFLMACPHHKDAANDKYQHNNHPWRKPNTGMLDFVSCELGVDMEKSVLVGDQTTDILAGHRSGLNQKYLVQTGHGKHQDISVLNGVRFDLVPSVADINLKNRF